MIWPMRSGQLLAVLLGGLPFVATADDSHAAAAPACGFMRSFTAESKGATAPAAHSAPVEKEEHGRKKSAEGGAAGTRTRDPEKADQGAASKPAAG